MVPGKKLYKTAEAHFQQFCSDNFRKEVASDVISGVIADPTRMDVRVKFDDSRSNCSQHIRQPHFVTDERRRPADNVVTGKNAAYQPFA